MWVDVIVIALAVVAVAGVIFTIIRNKKKGKSACGCDCANCPGCLSKAKPKDENIK